MRIMLTLMLMVWTRIRIFGCAELALKPEDSEGEGAGCSRGRGRATTLGINDVTTATGCAVSQRSARIFWESPRALVFLVVRRRTL